jgi:GNAT superfamily N-acetyltransferase
MLIQVRRAMPEDISRVLKFYAERRYGGGIRPEDALLLAEHDGELLGIVRLTTEEGVVVLRGMQVHPRFQRQGIGKRLLVAVAQELDGKGCFCIPYVHLVGFYGGIGFHVMEPAGARPFSACAWTNIETAAMGTIISSCAAKVSKKLLTRFAPSPVGHREFHDHSRTIGYASAACL